MTLHTLATQLKIPVRTLERESALSWINERLLEIESEILEMGFRHGASTTEQFLQQAKKGMTNDNTETLDDFFKLDHLQTERKKLLSFKKHYAFRP